MYDGAIIRQEGTENAIFIPVESTQIKSATDNVGTFEPENPNIRYGFRDTDENVQAQLTQLQTVMELTHGHAGLLEREPDTV